LEVNILNGLLFELYLVYVVSCTVCLQYQSSDWLWRPPPKWPRFWQVGC